MAVYSESLRSSSKRFPLRGTVSRFLSYAPLLLAFLSLPTLARRQEKPAQPLKQDEACIACHGQPDMKSGKGKSISIRPEKHSVSVHGIFGCTDCCVISQSGLPTQLPPSTGMKRCWQLSPILLWHFYMVIFDPLVYPMDTAWLDGKIPADHYRHSRPAYLKVLERAGLVQSASQEKMLPIEAPPATAPPDSQKS